MMIGGYEALANTQLLDFYKMLKILKLTPMGFAIALPDLRNKLSVTLIN